MRPRSPVATMNADKAMKPMLPKTFVAGLVATSVLAASASAGGMSPRAASVTLGAPVRHLAADAGGAAVHTQAGAGCDTILLWLPPAPPAKVATQNCQQPSTGAAVTSLALYGRRPAWAGYAGGNYREFTVSTTLRGRATFVSLLPVLVDDSAAVHWRVAPGGAPLAFEQDGSVWRIVPVGRSDVPAPVLRQGVRQGAGDRDAPGRRRRTAPPPRRRHGLPRAAGRQRRANVRRCATRRRPTARSSSSSRTAS